ncbi:MAG: DNA-binding protein [Firmicutes bacterium]|nr:DNA-binding protein [Bacillota bacterium]
MKNLSYRECQIGRRFILRLEPGARISESLVEFTRGMKAPFASLVSAVGSIRMVEFVDIQAGAHLPISGARLKTHKVEGPLELLSLEGNLLPDDKGELSARLYVLGSKSSGEVVGGRLVEAEVFASCEIVLAEYNVTGIERQFSPQSGVDALVIREDLP